ncbi:DUF3520 domain-containing protein [Segetibacter sp. 3557_3]|uniref:vWA domain-containing protein n=1 Tax=Segetibacter sp. 3557_3 TaxID=2547429 RepID=UPI0010588235|nr:VWA domain-containing protein [Segetibacter sp. 3557_3]TDH25622.1 DUF3520 domain-containing protein [Segetibacter sp. 3557_3]
MKTGIYLIILFAVVATAFTFSSEFKVSGKVVDRVGNPISGAGVVIKGTSTGTSTDSEGKFKLTTPSDKSVLVISAAGYEQVEVKAALSPLIISLKQARLAVQEVVVGALTKRRMVGAPVKDQLARQLYNPGYSRIQNGLAHAPANATTDTNVSSVEDNGFDREGYGHIVENRFQRVTTTPLSTFSIDVDAASYSNVRRMINEGRIPPAGAVRLEEMINYFSYDYPQPSGNDPFSVNTEVGICPWNNQHKLLSIGLQGKKIEATHLPASNLTFLIDVSGSMNDPAKLPLVKAAIKLLIDQLREQDRIAMVVYAGSAGLVLPPTSGTNKIRIKETLDQLEAGGSTAGGAGIALAYKTAKENFIKGGNNRVILCTDGDFNVGLSSDDALVRMIEEERKSGVYLTVLGFGTGNYQDNKMQQLADKGNGNHAYIDTEEEAKKVLVKEWGGTLFTIAKDVKLQLEFNPSFVQAYRLIGYENRLLAKEDFNDDKKDAGEMGSGHTVTALYEIIPAGLKSDFTDSVDELKYQQPITNRTAKNSSSNEMLTIKLRYKQPNADESKLLVHTVAANKGVSVTSSNLRFAAAVAEFGMLLRNSEYKGNGTLSLVKELASGALGKDQEGYRKAFIGLVDKTMSLNKNPDVSKAR